MARKRMVIYYLNPNMEGVRQVALRNFKEIYQEILEDLEIIEEIDWDKYFSKFFEIQEKWKKYAELAK